MTRRRGAVGGAALAAVALACLAASCSGSPGTAAPATAPWPAAPATGNPATITVTILSGTDTSKSPGSRPVPDPGTGQAASGMYTELVNWWNTYREPDTHIKIQLVTVPGGATAEHSEMLAEAESGDSGFDIYNLDNEWVPEFAAGNFIWSLQGHFTGAEEFLTLPRDSAEYDGRLYAVPFTTDAGLLYYRPKLLTSAQLAELNAPGFSFAGLAKLAGQVMAGNPQLTAGYAGQFADYEGLTVNLLEIAHAEDPGMFAADGTIADPGGLASALGQLSAFMTASTSGVIPAPELTYAEADAKTAFANGTALFMRNWPIYYEQIKAAPAGQHTSQVANSFDVRPLPFPSVLGGQDLAIARTSRNPAAAVEVIDFLTSPQAEQCLFQVGGFPATRASAYVAQPLPTRYGSASHPLCGAQAGQEVNIGPTIEKAINRAFLRPRTPYYTEFSSIIQHEVWPELADPGRNSAAFVSELATTLSAAAATGKAPPPLSDPPSPPATPPAP